MGRREQAQELNPSASSLLLSQGHLGTYLYKLPWARETRSSLYIMCHSGTMRPLFSSVPNMVTSLFLPIQGHVGAQHQTGQGSR